MKKSFISIIIPAYNEEKFIESTLKAVKNQDYKGKYEIIVVDNNSQDNTSKIARKYAKVILVKKKGAAAARNGGAKIARGDILVFIDADTIPRDNYLKTVEETFRDKRIIAATSPVLPLEYKRKELLGCLLLNEFLLRMSMKTRKPVLIGNNLVCRRDVFEKFNGFDEGVTAVEDIEFSLRLSTLSRKVKFMEDTFVLTSTRRAKKWGALKLIKTWPFGYIRLKTLNKSPSYRPVR